MATDRRPAEPAIWRLLRQGWMFSWTFQNVIEICEDVTKHRELVDSLRDVQLKILEERANAPGKTKEDTDAFLAGAQIPRQETPAALLFLQRLQVGCEAHFPEGPVQMPGVLPSLREMVQKAKTLIRDEILPPLKRAQDTSAVERLREFMKDLDSTEKCCTSIHVVAANPAMRFPLEELRALSAGTKDHFAYVEVLAQESEPPVAPVATQNPSLPTVPEGAAKAAPPAPYVFRKRGQFWEVTFEGTSGTIKDYAGMKYLSKILSMPNPSVGMASVAISPPADNSGGAAPDSMVDDETLAEYAERLHDIEAEISQAEKRNDLAGVDRLRNEKDEVRKAIKESRGLRSRTRSIGPLLPEQAALARVRRAILIVKDALRNAEPSQAPLADHLDQFVSYASGTWTYRPPVPAPDWQLF